jgi:hypothetical protein
MAPVHASAPGLRYQYVSRSIKGSLIFGFGEALGSCQRIFILDIGKLSQEQLFS